VTNALAQPYSAYVNDKDEFYVMDSLAVSRIEHLAPVSYKIGRNLIAYVDNTKNFKVYQYGQVRQIAEGYTEDYTLGNGLVVIRANRMLYAYDDGRVVMLSQIVDNYVAGDSIVGFYDNLKYEFNGYWNGQIHKLEDGIGGNPVLHMNAGDNVLAYTNQYNNFRIVYQGEIIDQENRQPVSTRCGANTVAYVDYDNTFKIFYNGETYTLHSSATRHYWVADNGLVAYVDNSGNFNIFDKGNVIEIGYYTPSLVRAVDNIVVYTDATGGLNVYYKGKTERIENHTPTDLRVSSNSVAYTNASRRVQFYTFGRYADIPNLNVEGIELDYDVLKIKTGFNSYRFFWKDNAVQ
ncbi:MAG TPA: hypothetical protein VEY71_08150, partial [Chitinophagales bacterium]|nr:hypothetical protein [Chitinophagales bacterium]